MILNLRNQIVTNEKEVINGDNRAVESLFNALFASIDGESKLPTFYVNKINAIKRRLADCSTLEKEYFYRYTRFISRELYHQKIGDIDRETPTGVASLWNSRFEERVMRWTCCSTLLSLRLMIRGTIWLSNLLQARQSINNQHHNR